VARGESFCGLQTQRTPTYYVDYENSLSLISDRARIIGPSEMKLWHLSNSIPPPRLDDDDWILFKELFPGLLIFDTLRSSQLLDENSSKDMALIMGRLKELRELGFTIILLHYTQKADARTYKESSAILDLCDVALGLERVREVGSDTVVEDDDDSDLPLRLGTREKTRYEPFHIYLKFNPTSGFAPTSSPEEGLLQQIHRLLIDYHRENGEPTQRKFVEVVREELNISKGRTLSLIKKGEGQFWRSLRMQKAKNSLVFCPIFMEN
jgi:hypothetical protein